MKHGSKKCTCQKTELHGRVAINATELYTALLILSLYDFTVKQTRDFTFWRARNVATSF